VYCPSMQKPSLNLGKIKAITLDLDDTLWPIWPAIERAEKALLAWLHTHASATAALAGDTANLRAIRNAVAAERPDWLHDLTAIRRESLRRLLLQAGDDPALAESAFEVFFAERQRVEFYPDALQALKQLAARFPIVSLSNGNADLATVGIAAHFRGAVSAQSFGVGKPDVRIFHAAARLAGAEPQAVLHVGDDAVLDVLGAHAAGMQTAWVNRRAEAWSAGVTPNVVVQNLAELVRELECG
jgi:FMN hydrolase / 5-amino-6-(5-phospho-D-ribitylamino)uracil phosphatase